MACGPTAITTKRDPLGRSATSRNNFANCAALSKTSKLEGSSTVRSSWPRAFLCREKTCADSPAAGANFREPCYSARWRI
jgi:hypothetical protein